MNKKAAYIVKEQKRITDLVTRKFTGYYLTGGTALAFHFKHRFSEDLDFFSQEYRKNDPNKIMAYISKETGFKYKLDAVQEGGKFVPMAVYFLALKDKQPLKIDFVKDFVKHVNGVSNGLHSVEDIYLRKMYAAIGTEGKASDTGRSIATGRQSVKDLFDIYYLSFRYKALSEVFFEYFPYNKFEKLDNWYRGFDRTETKLRLMDLVPGVDTGKVFKHLDDQILKRIPEKLR